MPQNQEPEIPNELKLVLSRLERNIRAKICKVMDWSKDVEHNKINDKTKLSNAEKITLQLVENQFNELINQFDSVVKNLNSVKK